VDGRTKLAHEVIDAIRENLGMKIRIFDSMIPIGVKAAEAGKEGKSIYSYNNNSKPAEAYANFTKEVIKIGDREQRVKDPIDR
jgi:chromosome partitioning protein